MKTTIQSVKGTRDFYPEEMAVRTWLYATIKRVSERYGYQEYEGPFIEKIDLYAAKSGEELVKEQAFVFPDRSGDLITLRPELTPTLARMVAQKQKSLIFPLRWWSFGPFWRYERPQKGRTREFFQWNIDMLGVSNVEADAELIAICAEFFKETGFKPDEVQISVNNRRLMDKALTDIGIGGDKRQLVFKLIDRKDKLPYEDWVAFGVESGLSVEQLEGVTKLLNTRDLWKQSEEMTKVFGILEAMDLMPYIRFDPKIIRGLDYYTGTVFEAVYLPESGRSICGGGRYDNLVGDVGGEPLSGVGFAMGDVMLGVLLEKHGLIPSQTVVPASVLITVFDQDNIQFSYHLANQIRQEGVNVICYPEAAKLQKQFKYADRLGIKVVIIAGPDEIAQGSVTLKDLRDGQQYLLATDLVADKIKELL